MVYDFSWHANALKGIRGPIHDGEPQSGFYRQRTTFGKPGSMAAGPWEAVAYWKDTATGAQRCHRNGREADPQRALEIWPYASANPITAEAYWHFIDTGEWQDEDAGAREARKGPDIDPATDPVGSMRAEIEKARAGLPDYATIESDEQAARAQTLRSALTALSGKADKARTVEKAPHLAAGKAVDDKWQPIVKLAQAGADDIRKALQAWETVKLQAQRKADEENRRREEAARREQEWQDAAPPGSVPERAAVPFTPAAPNTPPPADKIKGASGRAASVGVRRVVKSIDLDKCYEQFGGLPQVYNLFLELAQKAVDNGRDVPGATIEEEATIK